MIALKPSTGSARRRGSALAGAMVMAALILLQPVSEARADSDVPAEGDERAAEEARAGEIAAKHAEPGVQMVAISGGYKVFTQRLGEGPVKLLLLHGGPGMTHEYFENFADHLPPAGIQIIFYDQLGSYFSDQPDDLSLWQTARFVEELEEVRVALGLEDAYMLGNSWGGLLLMEYALKYPDKLKAVIISNMIADTRNYEAYVTGLRAQLAPELVATMIKAEAAEDYANAEYQSILFEHFYTKHLCRVSPWPDPLMRSFEHMSMPVYLTMMGPSEIVVKGNLRGWNRIDDLHRIDIPALVFGARYDTMNPEDMREVARRLPNARAAISDQGSHMTWIDDEQFYFDHLIRFLEEVEAGSFDERD